MGYVIEISESKVGKLSEHIEKGLRHIGKAMQCVDEWMEGEGYGERGSMGERSQRGGMRDEGSYGNRYVGGMRYMRPYAERDDEDWDEDDEDYMPHRMNERRGRSRTTGRYVRR